MQFPKIEIPEAKAYWAAYEYGEALDKLFPEQDASQFAYAIEYNDSPSDLDLSKIRTFKMIQGGERDMKDWVWFVSTDESLDANSTIYVVMGGCDYTGWDCRSFLSWHKIN